MAKDDAKPKDKAQGTFAENGSGAIEIHTGPGDGGGGGQLIDTIYEIVGGDDDDFFEVGPDNLLYFKNPPDFESGHDETYEVEIRYLATNGREATTTVTITLTDVEGATDITLGGNSNGTITIPEEQAGYVIGSLSATANAAITYSLGGQDAGSFEIIDGPGGAKQVKLLNSVTPDFESGKTSYDLTVVATSDGETTNKAFTINISDVNEKPEAIAVEASGDEDTPIEIVLSATDVDEGDTIVSFAITTPPSSGVFKDAEGNEVDLADIAAGEDGTATIYFHPDQDENGVFNFEYTAFDGTLSSEPASGTITVEAVDDAPTAKDIEACGLEDEPLAIILTACDPDAEDDILSFKLTSLPENGAFYASEDKSGGPLTAEDVILAKDGQATIYYFADEEHFSGEDVFAYNVVDSTGAEGEEAATGAILIKPVNDAPVAVDDFATTSMNTSISIDVYPNAEGNNRSIIGNDTDIDSRSLQLGKGGVLGLDPSQGTFLLVREGEGDAGKLVVKFTPAPGFTGVAKATYEVIDGFGEDAKSDQGEIAITVTAPAAEDDEETPGPGPNTPTPTPNDGFDGSIPALVVSSFVEGVIPGTQARLESLSNFAEFQFLSYQERGVARPELGPYEALGRGFAETTDFQDKYGALTEAAFILEAYEDVFGRQATAEQADHFQAQIDYFEALYASVDIPEDKAEMLAKGAALGQMLGVAVLDETDTQPYFAQAQAFLEDAADGVVEMGKPLAFYELN